MSDIFRKSALERISSPEQLDKIIKVSSSHSWLVLVALIIACLSIVSWVCTGQFTEVIDTEGIYMREMNLVKVCADRSGTVDDVYVSEGSSVRSGDVLATIDGTSIIANSAGMVNNKRIEKGRYVSKNNVIFEIRESLESKFSIKTYVTLSQANSISEGMEVMIKPSGISEGAYGHMVGVVAGVSKYGISIEELYRELGDEQLVKYFLRENNNEPIIEVDIKINNDDRSANGYKWTNPKGKELEMKDYMFMDVQVIAKQQSILNYILNSH